jgi:hypothetical protein
MLVVQSFPQQVTCYKYEKTDSPFLVTIYIHTYIYTKLYFHPCTEVPDMFPFQIKKLPLMSTIFLVKITPVFN